MRIKFRLFFPVVFMAFLGGTGFITKWGTGEDINTQKIKDSIEGSKIT